MTDFLDEKRREITDRLKELKPLVDEYSRLEAAASALAGVRSDSASTTAAPRRRGPGRPRGSAKRARKTTARPARFRPARRPPAPQPKRSAKNQVAPADREKSRSPRRQSRSPRRQSGRPKGRVGRRKGSGTRAAQALSFVQGQPGITIPELAAKMGIKQNYLYRVLPGLEQEGKLEKKGRGWHPKPSRPPCQGLRSVGFDCVIDMKRARQGCRALSFTRRRLRL